MAMTRKDFVAVADSLVELFARDEMPFNCGSVRDKIIAAVANGLWRTNNRFDGTRFRSYVLEKVGEMTDED